MRTKDYKMILDSLQKTGIYVIREKNHEILYYNRHVAEVAPNIKEGMICHEVWAGSCDNCPLIHIGDKQEEVSINYDDPFGKIVEIRATRIMWEDSIPAFLIMVSPYTETDANIRKQEIINIVGDVNFAIYVVDLKSGAVDAVRIEENMQRNIGENFAWGDMFKDKGMSYIAQESRKEFWEKFSLDSMREAWENGEKKLVFACQALVGGTWKYISASAFLKEDRHKGGYAIVTFQDVDEQTKNEMARTRNDHRIAAIIRSSYSILNTVDLETGICERIYLEEASGVGKINCDYSEYIQRTLDNSVLEEDKAKFEEVFLLKNLRKKAEDVKEFKEEICQYRLRTNPVMWIEEHLLYIRQGSQAIVNILGRDITDEKMAQERKEQAVREACDAANHASEAKSEFMSRMSHDIRTPMNAIIGMTAIAGKHLDNRERVADCLDKITISSNQLLALINEVLDMSNIESGKIELNEEAINLPELIDDILSDIKPAILHKHHSLDVRIADVEHKDVIGDTVRLQQIFINILSNAVKYTPDGGHISLELNEKPSSVQGCGDYEFTVIDNGIGMSKEFQKRLFEPFSREEDSRVSKIEGTGLGMTIARNIVRRMNGDIMVESESGKGTKLVVSLSLKLPGIEESGADDNADGGSYMELCFEGKRLLLVEDNELNREIAVEILSQTGVEIECAENGQEALEMFAKMPENYYNLIFMDIQMPVMNGHDATVAIRSLAREDAAKIPIIALTANAFAEDMRMSKKAGMNEHMTKPLDFGRLMQCLQRWMG